jgi:hypothetical protein
MFCDSDRLEPYYLAALALVKLEYLFRSEKIDAQMKPAWFHIFRRCDAMIKAFLKDWEKILAEAVKRVMAAAKGNLDRDYIRTEPGTEALLEQFGYKGGDHHRSRCFCKRHDGMTMGLDQLS